MHPPLEDTQGHEWAIRSTVAALAFLVYDILLTFGDEVEYVWPSRWTANKALYFFVRYFTLFSVSAFHFRPGGFCKFWIYFEACALQIIFASVDYILVNRVLAIYTGHTAVRRLVLGAFAINMLSLMLSLFTAVPRVHVVQPGCFQTFPATLMVFNIVSLVFETLLFALTAARFVRALREGWGRTSILAVVARDQTWAYALIFAALVISGLFFVAAPPYLHTTGVPWLLATLGFCGPRLVLNVRKDHANSGGPDLDIPVSDAARVHDVVVLELRHSRHHSAPEP